MSGKVVKTLFLENILCVTGSGFGTGFGTGTVTVIIYGSLCNAYTSNP